MWRQVTGQRYRRLPTAPPLQRCGQLPRRIRTHLCTEACHIFGTRLFMLLHTRGFAKDWTKQREPSHADAPLCIFGHVVPICHAKPGKVQGTYDKRCHLLQRTERCISAVLRRRSPRPPPRAPQQQPFFFFLEDFVFLEDVVSSLYYTIESYITIVYYSIVRMYIYIYIYIHTYIHTYVYMYIYIYIYILGGALGEGEQASGRPEREPRSPEFPISIYIYIYIYNMSLLLSLSLSLSLSFSLSLYITHSRVPHSP